jgi:hypothetical protein
MANAVVATVSDDTGGVSTAVFCRCN